MMGLAGWCVHCRMWGLVRQRGIMARGRGSQLAKVDIRSAYRNVPVHPEDRWLLGMVWRDALFVDVTMPFGQ